MIYKDTPTAVSPSTQSQKHARWAFIIQISNCYLLQSKTMRSTFPTTILTIVLASVFYSSSARLSARGLDGKEPSCKASDLEPFLPNRMT